MSWKRLRTNILLNHPKITLVEDDIELSDGSPSKYLRFEEHGAAVTLICRNEDGKILLSREYAYPVDQMLYQFPGGGTEKDEAPEAAANRELMEEVGYRAQELIPLGRYLINNRRSQRYMHVYLAQDLVAQSLPGDPEEEIHNKWVTQEELETLMRDGNIVNVNVLAAWTLFKMHQSTQW